jgi:cytochrome P450 PksS
MDVDFSSQDYFRNPAAAIAKLQSAGPVVEVRFPILGRIWTTTTEEMANRVLKDSRTFSMRRDDGNIAGVRWWMPGIVRTLANHMLSMDEPDHRRLRDIVDEAFRRRAILEMEPRILAIADELADGLFAQGIPADLVERYARQLPLAVICELLGLPLADRAKFTAWAGGFTRFTGTIGFISMIPKIVVSFYAMRRYLEQQLEVARGSGGEGLVAELVRVEKNGGQISRNEMVSMVFCCCSRGTKPPRISSAARCMSS